MRSTECVLQNHRITEVFYKKGVPRNYAKFTEKAPVPEPLF